MNEPYVLDAALRRIKARVAALEVTVARVRLALGSNVTYDNGTSGLTATDVQAAIDELEAEIVALALDDLSDVSVPSPVDGDVLTYNDYLAQWEAVAPTGGALAYEDLTDVDMTGITDGQIPVWDDGTSTWLPGDASGVTEITDLPTAETTTTKRLAPDGAGGVEWVAGGGGGSSLLQQVIPGMFANSWAGYTASASESYATAPPWMAFCEGAGLNGTNRYGWLDNGSTLPQWLRIQLPTACTATAYAVMPWWVDNYPGRAPKTWTFEGSNDGSSWTTLDTQTNFTAWNASTYFNVFTFTNSTAYAYYRLNISANGGNAYVGVGGFHVYAPLSVT